MRPTILILILLLSILFVPPAIAEDAIEWNTKGQDALTAGAYSAAVTYFNNALQLDKNLAPAYAGRAAALNMQGKYSLAIESADSCLAIKSMDPVALNARALALFRLGQYAEAAAAYDKLFLVEQNRKEAYCNQGYAYLYLNKSDASVAAYDRCTSLDPLAFENWNNKGLALMQAKKYDAALEAFNQATYVTIKNATVWNNKGIVLVELGKPSDAIECFKKALGIDPDYADAKKNLENAMGRQQSFNISGTITPKPTISRIGTFFTTVTPTKQATEVVTEEPGPEDTVPAEVTGTTIPKKTTYSPVSPITILGALAVVAGLVVAIRRK